MQTSSLQEDLLLRGRVRYCSPPDIESVSFQEAPLKSRIRAILAHFTGSVPTTLTLILLQKHRDSNQSRIVIQIGGGCTTFCQEEGIL